MTDQYGRPAGRLSANVAVHDTEPTERVYRRPFEHVYVREVIRGGRITLANHLWCSPAISQVSSGLREQGASAIIGNNVDGTGQLIPTTRLTRNAATVDGRRGRRHGAMAARTRPFRRSAADQSGAVGTRPIERRRAIRRTGIRD